MTLAVAIRKYVAMKRLMGNHSTREPKRCKRFVPALVMLLSAL